jgi:hypothetical protein
MKLADQEEHTKSTDEHGNAHDDRRHGDALRPWNPPQAEQRHETDEQWQAYGERVYSHRTASK